MVIKMERETEYISDGNHNYLRINCGEDRKDTYPYKMITENTIRGLLPCRVRVVNGITYLYYEIHSKQTLFYRYEIKEMDYESLKNIFFYLCLLGEELEKYFLDFNDITFDEKYIFQDMETGETEFLFFPETGDERKNFATFMEYIVRKVNHKDAKAVQVAYRLYDLSRQEHILVREIRQIFEEEKENMIPSEHIEYEVPKRQEESGTKLFEEKPEEWEWISSEKSEKENRAKWSDILIPSFLCVSLTLLLCLKISVRMTYEEETVLIAGIVVVIGLFVAYIVYRIWRRKEHNKENQKISKIYSPETDLQELDKVFIEHKEENVMWQQTESRKEENYGTTVFLEPEPENILYGLGKFEKLVIKLDHFPFSVGKMKEEVDFPLKDTSVSRLHARFYQENNAVYLMDLNSTNGTFKNGFRIPANEKVLLEEGDEIIFGKVRLCYR